MQLFICKENFSTKNNLICAFSIHFFPSFHLLHFVNYNITIITIIMENKWKSSTTFASKLNNPTSLSQSSSSTSGDINSRFGDANNMTNGDNNNNETSEVQRISKLESLTQQLNEAKEKISGSSHIQSVKMSSVSILRIISHCTRLNNQKSSSSGSLLGIDIDGVLEITNCIPFPETLSLDNSNQYNNDNFVEELSPLASLAATNQTQKKASKVSNSDVKDASSFAAAMIKQLKLVNVDSNTVGWYKSTDYGKYCTPDIIKAQFELQDDIEKQYGIAKSVLIVFDPQHSVNGALFIKALRLTDSFMKSYRLLNTKISSTKGKSTQDAFYPGVNPFPKDLMSLTSNEIFEEVPIQITNPHLLQPLLHTFKNVKSSCFGKVLNSDKSNIRESRNEFDFNTNFSNLDLTSAPYIEKNLQFLIEEIGNLQNNQRAIQDYQKEFARRKQWYEKWLAQRRAENANRIEKGESPLPEIDETTPKLPKGPSRIETTMIRKQIGTLCDQSNKYAATSLSKLYLYNSIQQQQQ